MLLFLWFPFYQIFYHLLVIIITYYYFYDAYDVFIYLVSLMFGNEQWLIRMDAVKYL